MSPLLTALVLFYGERNWRDPFGIRRWINGRLTAPHKGLDIAATARQAIPALRGGKIHAIKFSAVLGWVVVVKVSTFRYDAYAHLWGPALPTVGATIRAGESLGHAAGWNDVHGSAWSGPHLHLTTGRTSSVWYGVGVSDPAPIVRAALIAAAQTARPTPIPTKPHPTREKDDMANGYRLERYTDKKGNHEWALIHEEKLPAGFERSTNGATVGSWQRIFDIPTAEVTMLTDAAQFERDLAEAGAARTKYLAARAQER